MAGTQRKYPALPISNSKSPHLDLKVFTQAASKMLDMDASEMTGPNSLQHISSTITGRQGK